MAAVVWDIGVGSYPSYLSPPQLFHRPYILVNATVHAPPPLALPTLPSLVAGSRADPVQARCHGVQSATWKCT